MKLKLIGLLLFVTGFVSVYSQPGILTGHRTTGSGRTAVDDRGTSGVRVTYSAGSLSVSDVLVEGQVWHRVSMPGYQRTMDQGKPQLPVFGEMVMVPEGAGYSFSVSYTRSYLSDENSNLTIYPALAPATDRYGDPEPTFAIDSITYQTNAFWPESPVRLVSVQELRGMQVLWFDIMPVSYNPVTRECLFYEDITIDLSFTGSANGKFLDYSQHSETFLRNFPLLAVNAASIAGEINMYLGSEAFLLNQMPATGSNYILLTDSVFLAAADRFADWKRQLGYTVEVVAGSNWTFNAMKQAVLSRYQQWPQKPDYLLILGDHDRLPAEMVLNPDNEFFGTDLHLVTMGVQYFDYLPDMAKGRISVSSAAQAMTVVDKIINYEKNPPADSSFYLTGLNSAQFQDDDFDSYADRRFVHTSEEILSYLSGKGYDIKRVYYADTSNSIPLFYNLNYYSNGQSLPAALLSPTFNWNGNASQINSYINNGVFYVLHRDHGLVGGSGWGAPYYVSTHISSLNNGSKTPVVFSVNCHTGEFTLPECFAERFQRHATGGAVGVVAASYYSYSGWNDAFTTGMFDAIWSSPGLLPDFGSGGFSIPAVTQHPDIRNMGFVLNHGLIRMTQTWSTALIASKYQHRLMHYFGDPSMRIRTAKPSQITALHSDSLLCSDTLFQIDIASFPNAVATLTIPGKIIGRTTLSNGSGNIPIAPFASTYLLLTISGPEHIPYTDTVWVIPTPLTVNVTKDNVKCQGKPEGNINLEISCGVQPFTIIWSHGPSAPMLNNLPAGMYYFTVTDAVNMTISDSVEITEPATPIQLSGSVSNVLCYYGNDGSITLTVSGGVPPYQYNWSNGSTNPSTGVLQAGKMIVTVTDFIGCVTTDTFTVGQPLPLQINDSVNHDTGNNCSGSATALPYGGTPPYTFLWNDPNEQTTQTATGLCPGVVRVYVTDDHGCVTVRNVTIYNTFAINDNDDLSVEVFPNPLKGEELFVRLPAEFELQKLHVVVVNSIGQELLNKQFTPEDQLLVIKPFPKQKGIYMLSVYSEEPGITIMRKIIKD